MIQGFCVLYVKIVCFNYKNNLPIIDNGTLFALTLLIAESEGEKIEIIKQMGINALNKGENYVE